MLKNFFILLGTNGWDDEDDDDDDAICEGHPFLSVQKRRRLQYVFGIFVQVGTALQVFHNLGMLVSSVEKVLTSLTTSLNHSVATALDVNALLQMTQSNRKGERQLAGC